MDRQLKIGERIAQKSILQGGMGIGISLGNLAGAVAKCGGVGMISAAQIGFREPDFDENTEEANVRAMQLYLVTLDVLLGLQLAVMRNIFFI